MRSPARGGVVAGVLPAFWPSLATLAVAARSVRLVLRDDLPFDPESGLHRARLPSPAGQTWITLPVRGALPAAPVREIALAPASEWAPRAMRAVEHAFSGAPYFEHYRCDLARLLFQGWTRLADLDVAMLQLLLRSFGVDAEVLRASTSETKAPLVAAPILHGVVSSRPAIEILFERGPGARALLARRRVAGRPRRGARPHRGAPVAQAAAVR